MKNVHMKKPVSESLFNKYAGLKACNFIKNRPQHRYFPAKFTKFLRTPFFTEYIRQVLLEISHELSLYCIWEQWMVSFRGTYWLPNVYFILLRVVSFLSISFFFSNFFWYVCQYLKQSSGVVPRFLSGVSRGELLQPYLVINLPGLVQFGKNISYILLVLAS